MRERGPREASAREESEVCMERKRSEEIRGESGDGIVGDDEGRERAEGQKAGCYSLWCGVVYLRSNLPPCLCCIHYCNCTTWTAASISDLAAKTCLLAMFCLSPSATEATLRLHAAPWDPHVQPNTC